MTDTTAKITKTTTDSVLKTFTPINQLIKDSWERVKRTWKQVILLYIVLVAFFVVTFGGFGAYLAASGISMSGSPEAIASLIASGVLIATILVIASVAVSSIFQAATILAVSESKEYPTIGSKIKRGFQLFIPLFVTSFIMMFLVFGGIGFLIFPGIAIAILTSYTLYEVILTENTMVSAIRNSVTIVQQNFGAIFSRLLLIFLISIGIEIVFGILKSGTEETSGAALLIDLLSLVIQPVYSLFSIAYIYQIYKEAREMTNFKQPASMIWMWIVAILGWILGAFLIISIAKFAGPMLEDAMNKEFGSDSTYSTGQSDSMVPATDEFDADSFIEQYGEDMSEEEKDALRESIKKTEQMMQLDNESAQNEDSI